MTTIATFFKPEEAHLLRMRLEAGGIAAFTQDENLVQIEGGMRVQVADEDAEAARELMAAEGEPSDDAP